MADPRSAPLSFRPPSRTTRDEEFDERLFDQVSVAPPAASIRQDTGDDDAEEEPPREREGLPAGFRMRADAHYVEQLVSRRLADPIVLIPVGDIDRPRADHGAGDLDDLVRSVRRFGIIQPLLVRRRGGRYELIAGLRRLSAAATAGLAEVPCLVHSADDDRARELGDAANLVGSGQATSPGGPLPGGAFAELTEQLGAIDACLHLFAERERPTRERVGMALIRTEVRRAAWLAQALGVLSWNPPVARRPLDLAALVGRVVLATASERSVTGVEIEADASEPVSVEADEQLLTTALAGLVEAVQAAAERCPGARVSCRARQDDERAVVTVALVGAPLPCALQPAFLDLRSADRPGGARAAIGIKAASLVAERHGGTLTATDTGSPSLVLSIAGAGRATTAPSH